MGTMKDKEEQKMKLASKPTHRRHNSIINESEEENKIITSPN